MKCDYSGQRSWRRLSSLSTGLPAATGGRRLQDGCRRLVASHDVAAVACFASASTRQVGFDAVLFVAAATAGVRGWPPRLGLDTVVQWSGAAATCMATAQWSVATSSVEWGLHRVVALMMELKRRCSDVERGRTEEDRWSHGGGDALIAMKETGVRFLLSFLQFRPYISFCVFFNFVLMFPFDDLRFLLSGAAPWDRRGENAEVTPNKCRTKKMSSFYSF